MQNLPLYLILCGAVTVAAMLWSFIHGLRTRNYSTVDRLWSLLPGLYIIIAFPWLEDNPRLAVGGGLILVWCIRLTRNFAKKGGYRRSGGRFIEEDYRWAVMRERIPNRFVFEIFNLFFISIFQLALILGFTLPVLIAGASKKPLTALDVILFGVHALLLSIEWLADEQQFHYYSQRGRVQNPRMDLGFNTFGLWKYSRHPNYVCEMAQWIVVGLYPLAAGLGWHPWGWASVILVLLFIGSTRLAEEITGGKYPRYRDWKKATPSWLPFSIPFRLKARKQFWESLEEEQEESSRAWA